MCLMDPACIFPPIYNTKKETHPVSLTLPSLYLDNDNKKLVLLKDERLFFDG